MRRLAALLIAAAASACGGASGDGEPRPAFDEARRALRGGAVEEALAHLDRSRRSLGDANDSADAHRHRLLHAEILLARPDVAGAAALLDTPLPERDDLAPLRARDHYLRARLHVARGRLADALATADQVAGLSPPDGDARLDAEILAGQILLRQGRWADGEARLKAAAAAAAGHDDRYRQVLALNNLGMGFVVRNRFGEALPWFEQVLAFDDLAETSVYVTAMNNAGMCYARLGDLERAIATQERAVARHEQRGAAAPYEQALGELGSTHLLRDDVGQAIVYLTRALSVASAAGLDGDAAIWARNLAAAHVQQGNWDEAERVNGEARRLTGAEAARKLVFNTLHDANIAAGRNRPEAAAALFRAALDEAAGEPSVAWAAHEGLAVLARRAGDRARAARHLDAALAIIERTRSDLLQADYRMSFVTRLVRFYRLYVDLLIEQGEVERALAIADASRGRVLGERHGTLPPPAAAPGAFRRLAAASGRVLAAYWLAPERSYLWVVDGRGIRLHTLPPAGEIERLVREHQAAIHDALADPLAPDGAGDRLARTLVAPLLDTGAASVVIVPDGALHGLNFETLAIAGPRRHYWIEDVEIQVAPSLALLREPPRPSRTRPLLLVGDPTPRPPEFPALRFAAAEMSRIAGHFDGAFETYAGADASPRAFREARPERFALVHFTAHATANRDSPLDSAVILSGPDEGFKLYARDAADLPLAADLVTVSACRSAGERVYSGEGLVGFAWAFLRAGARRVVAGLWDVDDRSTADLMDAMYARLAAGASPPAALRAAKLTLLARGGAVAKPYYWGPFQVFTVAID